MLNLFKSEQTLVREIHNAFDTAEDRLLKQADNLLAELNIETDSNIHRKAELASEIGFTNVPIVKRSKEIKEKVVETKDQAELIRYYKQTYPFQKFLTESELDFICNKYNLVYAPISNYIEDVPEKNLKEISRAKQLMNCDTVLRSALFSSNGHGGDEKLFLKLLGKKEAIFTEHELRELGKKYYLSTSLPERWISFDGSDYSTLFYCISEGMKSIGMISTVSYNKRTEIKKQGLFIAAPQSHFDLKGLSKHKKFGFLNISVVEVKDPIVFRYCRGGIQVLSKWGLEASDELVVNSIDN